MSLPLRTHSATHSGLQHPRNEDAYAVMPTGEGGVLLVVCDGMGGMGRGDEASKIAVEALCAAMANNEGLIPERMREALRVADQQIRDTLCADFELPGSTGVMAYVLDGSAHVAWVGDSRAYLVRDGRVMFRTRDHKLVEELVDAGQLTPEEAKESALAHVVTRALGGRAASEPPVQPATLGYPWRLRHGDQILLCSDGVCDLVTDDEIPGLLKPGPPEDATDRLVQTALLRGGHDNITCIVAVWDGPTAHEDDGTTPIIQESRKNQPGHAPFGRAEDPEQADGRVTEEIDLVQLEAEAKAQALRARLGDRGEDDDDDISDLPTAEVPRPTPAAPPLRERRPEPGPPPSPGLWVGVGVIFIVLAVIASVVALLA